MNEQKEWPTMDAGEAAEILGITRGTFSRKKKSLIAHEGMPCPLPGGRYSRMAFMRWLESYGANRARETRESIASLRVSWDRAKLEATYAGAAA